MTRDEVIKALSLCRYDPDPGQESKQLVSCDICPYWSDEVGCRMTDLFNDALALLKHEQKRGRWITYPECLAYEGAYSDDHIVCSECESVWSIMDNDTERFQFCPNCGAGMGEDHA